MKLRNKTTGEEFCEVKQEFHSQYEANNEKWDMLSCSKEPVTPPPTTPPPSTTTAASPATLIVVVGAHLDGQISPFQ